MLLIWNFGESRDKKKSRSADVVSWAVHSGNCVFIVLVGVFVHCPPYISRNTWNSSCANVCVCVLIKAKITESQKKKKEKMQNNKEKTTGGKIKKIMCIRKAGKRKEKKTLGNSNSKGEE